MYEILVGLEVTNDVVYQSYREGMAPFLKQYDGSFGYDFKVSEVLKAEQQQNINRVFTIRFPTESRMNEFFADPGYLAVKDKFFTNSVASTTIIAAYEKHL